MRKYLKGMLAGLFITMLLMGGTGAYTIMNLQSNAKLINYVGIVRGATQRLIKLEMSDQPDDTTLEYLDNIMAQLNGEKGEYDLPTPDDAKYQRHLKKLNSMWSELKQHIYGCRENKKGQSELLELSEDYFEKANETVFAAQEYTSSQLRFLMYLWGAILAAMLLVWIFIIWASSKKMLDLESRNRRLSDIMKRDTLTGVYQFPYFKEIAQDILNHNKDRHYAVIYTDFHDFKYINDVFGYAYGDSILSSYGRILMKELKENELCGRVSADNFVLLLSYDKKEEIALRQQKADDNIREFMHNAYDHQVLTTCCGICCIDAVEEHLTIGGYVDRANIARSRVKHDAHENYVYYDDAIRKHLMEEKTLESRMQTALDNHEFIIEYQPKVDLKTKKIASAEALVRWNFNHEQIIPPDRFIPLFERKLMIDRLDQYVMESVCRWMAKMLKEGKRVLPVAVNVSKLQFYDKEFVKRYVEIRDRYQIPDDMIEIEITESIVFDDNNMLKIINALNEHHMPCAIDDFGKGYSALSMLRDLPIRYLKIDRYFFEHGVDQSRDLVLVKGIIEIVHKLHMKTIAEGIESMEQVEMLRRMDCDYIQGFVFYRPMRQEAYEKLLQQDDKVE